MHRMMLSDSRFHQAIENSIVQDNKTAEYAVYSVGQKLWEHFMTMEDPYLQARGNSG